VKRGLKWHGDGFFDGFKNILERGQGEKFWMGNMPFFLYRQFVLSWYRTSFIQKAVMEANGKYGRDRKITLYTEFFHIFG
jgi:hypothetical protein